MKEKILFLRSQGKTYNEIKQELGCSKSTISYHCGSGQKEKCHDRVKTRREKGKILKKCSRCKDDKSVLLFRKNKSRKDGLQRCCIDCDKDYQKEWYGKNKEKHKKKSKVSNKARISLTQEYARDYLSKNPCVKCGEKDIVVLEFDHIKNKKTEISKLIKMGTLKKLKEEIKKCQVLCANCHKRKTAIDFNWHKK